MKHMRLILMGGLALLASLHGGVFADAGDEQEALNWEQIATLPALEGDTEALGVAGPLVGVHNDGLIIAGGANFARPVWENDKVWHDDIYVLTREGIKEKTTYAWHTGQKLSRPLAYGMSISTDYGVVCMGGNDAENVYDEVFLLSWNPDTQNITQRSLGTLPKPCAYGCAVKLGDAVYVAGGTSGLGLETAMTNFWSADISGLDQKSELEWRELPGWPGSARAFNLAVSQHNGQSQCVYVLSGRYVNDRGEVTFLRDVYEFDPGRLGVGANPWRKRTDMPRPAGAGLGADIGQSHIVILGGADGSLFSQADALKDDHPGFPKSLLAYNTVTDTWFQAGAMPMALVTTEAVKWGDDIIIASGELRPRVRSPQIWRITPTSGDKSFGNINYITLGVYLLAMLGVGVYFSARNKNTDDYFRGGKKLPWFVAGLSIFATMLSSITFISIPGKVFATDWVFFLVNMAAIAVAPLVAYLIMPFFQSIDATSAYEYLEKRFNVAVRLFGSLSFVVFQIGRMAIVMYIPSLMLATITDLTETQCILLMGGLSILYCTLGGITAVVWTDTIQTFVLLGGALLSLLLIIWRCEGSAGELISLAANDGKFHMINWDWGRMSITTAALWVVVLGGLGQQFAPYTSDQSIVQRYMTVPNVAQARRAIWTNTIVIIPASVLFFGIGTALYVFYKFHPENLDIAARHDGVFPCFIANELPVGVAGLVVAGIFAAAQSTISTSMNSTSTALVTDICRRFNMLKSEQGYLWLARAFTVVLGGLGTLFALWVARENLQSLWEQFMKILGLITAPLCGLFCLGLFTRRVGGAAALMAAIATATGLYFIQNTSVHFLLYAPIGIGLCFIGGWFISLFLPSNKVPLAGLTIFTREHKE